MPNYLLQQPTGKKTPQSQPIPGREKDMAKNNAGGFTFTVDSFAHLERFLILGSEGGSYYASENDLTKQNVNNVRACLDSDGLRAVSVIRQISQSGRAPKNDPAIYALALAASCSNEKTREMALASISDVCRTGTHLFTFASFIDGMRGWGPALRRAVASWYTDKDAGKLAYQAVKYQQRNGWSHSDMLRLAHPKPRNEDHKNVFQWIREKECSLERPAMSLIAAFEGAKKADESDIIKLIREYGLTREMIPTEHQKSPKVWEALLEKMPLTAMIRTLGRMGSVGLLTPMSDASARIVGQLQNAEALKKARVHPIQVLTALMTYQAGRGTKGSLTWAPVPQVIDALNGAFYSAFDLVEPTGKRYYLGVDVSGSMGSGMIAGAPGLTPRHGAAAMAMLTARTEQKWYAAGFSNGSRVKGGVRSGAGWMNSVMERLPISKSQRLDTVMQKMAEVPMGGTDCALPMLDALDQKIPVDCFIIYTDNETWAGGVQPVQALNQYRQKMGIDSKLIVCGMTATEFTIADPGDKGMLDIVGFDTAVPTLISQFVGGAGGGSGNDED